MSLKNDIVPYLTVDGYVCPNRVMPGTIRGCDNQPLFTSIYYMLLNRNKELLNSDVLKYKLLINACIGSDGCLHRAPGDTSSDTIDDHLGVLAGYAEFGIKANFKLSVWYPQVVYAYLLSLGVPSLLMFPLAIINACVISGSCIGAVYGDSNDRQLNWLLIQSTKRKSYLARLAAKIWSNRESKVYNSTTFMITVCRLYYQIGHPFITYFI